MRLQLTVQRHALPPARILWTTNVLGPPYSAAGTEPTISQFLEQINDIIPLESGEWGLEDYKVEVGSFECLHFLEIGQVLKEGDEVCIRPLSTSDLRCRKISGRHQISTDGKHLIDGVAFGRPFLRRAERPAVRIPPRKRRRLTYDNDDGDNEDYNAQRQVVVHADFNDDEASVADSDYSGDEGIASEDEDLSAELNDIQNDLKPPRLEPTANGSAHNLNGAKRHRQKRATGLGLRASSFLVDENGIPYPAEYNNPFLDMLEDGEGAEDLSLAVPRKRQRLDAGSRNHQKDRCGPVSKARSDGSRRNLGANGKSVRFEEAEFATPATVRLGSSDDSESDDDFEPSSDASSAAEEPDESDKENATPGSRRFVAVNDSVAESDSSSSSDSKSEAEETSSSGSSELNDSSSESDDDYWHGSGTPHEKTDLQSTSSSETSSSSGSRSSSENEQSKRKADASRRGAQSSSSKKALVDPREKSSSSRNLERSVPPGAGHKRTQKRNQRRRDRKRLLQLQRIGTLGSDATIADLRRIDAEGRGQPKEDVPEDALSSQVESADFEAKRKALLRAISSGGIDQEDNLERNGTSVESHQSKLSPEPGATEESDFKRAAVEKSSSNASQKTLVDTWSTPQIVVEASVELPSGQVEWSNAQESLASLDQTVQQAPAITDEGQSTNEISSSVQKPRTKLDRDSSKRLVFGALGLRVPKTKEDEKNLREKLMKNTEVPRKSKPQVADTEDVSTNALALEEDDSWKEKIKLSAVECCYDGVELSTPPFPFVQRWDPQQQKGYFARRSVFSQNNKKRKRNNKQYEESFEPFADAGVAKRRQRPSYGVKVRFENRSEPTSTELQYDDAQRMSDDNLQAVNDQLLRETEESYKDIIDEPDALDDLPQLPDDISACAGLEQEACKAGAIVAFKQLDMSSETNWQPRISNYRTALIEDLLEDGTLLMRIASRDRRGGKKQYDNETGERLYSKFEMPGYNEDESERNDGLLELAFADLIEPKLVKASTGRPKPGLAGKQSSDTTPHGNEAAKESQVQVSEVDQGPISFADLPQKPFKDMDKSLTDAEVTEQVRREINDLIQDAGWRSSIQSNRIVEQDDPDISQDPAHKSTEALQEMHDDDPLSPHFNGFSSSPPAEEYQEAEEQVIYPAIKGLSSIVANDGTTDDPNQTTTNSSDQADSKAIQALREDFEKELNQPFASPTPDQPSQSSGKPESSIPPSETSHPKSTPPPADSLKSTIPDSAPPNPATTSEAADSHDATANNHDSDSDFPSLETVFTSFNSQRDAIKNEHLSSDDEEGTSILQSLPPHKAKINSKNNRSANTNDDDNGKDTYFKPPPSSAPPSVPTRASKSAKARNAKSKSRLNRYEAAPRSSQDWVGTQVVDLTLSSDPVATAMEEEGDAYVDGDGGSSLPKGPGWVKKNSRQGRTKAR
ncbi:MAG: hypothetical protein Q9225_001980 [Loekoesia sp. 1 TL-2023]